MESVAGINIGTRVKNLPELRFQTESTGCSMKNRSTRMRAESRFR